MTNLPHKHLSRVENYLVERGYMIYTELPSRDNIVKKDEDNLIRSGDYEIALLHALEFLERKTINQISGDVSEKRNDIYSCHSRPRIWNH